MGNTGLARPTPSQLIWQDMETTMFIHFVAETYKRSDEPDNTFIPVERIRPEKFDADQWAEAALSFDAKMIVMVAKHCEGFCWWQTETSSYGVKELPWRNGKADLVAELSAACRRRGVRLGIYLGARDVIRKTGEAGRCLTPQTQRRYDAVYRQQLTELLSRYGEVAEVWFDGSVVVEIGDILKQYAPDAMVFGSRYATIRWVGNENGFAPYPCWNSVKAETVRTVLSCASGTGILTPANGSPDGDVWLPVETDTTLHKIGWCWSPGERHLKSLDYLMETYYRSVGHGTVLLLNNGPDPSGLIPAEDMKRCAEFGAEIRRRFGRSVAECAGQGATIELPLPDKTSVDHVVMMEDIAFGERVREYVIEGLADGQWRGITTGTAIGHKKIDFFQPITASCLRCRVVKSEGTPLIRRMAAFQAGLVPAHKERAIVYDYLRKKVPVGKWDEKDLSTDWTTLEFDITRHVKEAQVYDMEIMPIPAEGFVEVKKIELVLDGVAAADFVAPDNRPLCYYLTITACDSPYRLRLTLRRRDKVGVSGQVLIGPLAQFQKI